MIVTISHQIDVSSVQKATALRDKTAEWLTSQDVTVTNSVLHREDRPFKVIGVDVKTTKPFTETVDAQDEDGAKVQVETKDRVVAAVEPAR